MEILKVIILSLSSLLLIFVGASRLLSPVKALLKNSGITLSEDVNLLNEIRGESAVMLCGGIIIGLGTIVNSLTMTSFIVGVLLFFGFALGRSVSRVMDGKPNKQIGQGLAFEIFFGLANVMGLIVFLS
ncbi:DUF4345 family protein [Flammeovirga sp. EKP202]|uniref:DUF4345 family protein n=1 Tax=Flammeovirga sp. EKP202 TaxID=2770592 RepID=UPI00165F7F73|nr:DUF4345 family protein [Flammeovirga sp. EKP202]MBD0404529.1 DUF4345 family protein [Flammeovirga sp. EKP202]